MISDFFQSLDKRLAAAVVVLVLSRTVCCAGPARAWTLKDGRTVEASFIAVIGDSFALKTEKGRQVKIPIELISEEDRTFVELSQPPKLELDFIRNLETITFSEGLYGTYFRYPEQQGNFGLRIRQTSAGTYRHPLKAEMYVVAQQIGVTDKKHILLDRQAFDFTIPETGKKVVEFMSERQVRLENWNFEYSDCRAVDHGEVYYGYLIAVTDSRNEIIAIRTSKVWLEESLENLSRLSVGNYFGKDCIRCFPGRPQPLKW